MATKGGTNEFHGSGYYFKRHEGWNANSFDNNRRSQARQIYRFMTAGYTVGGPDNAFNHTQWGTFNSTAQFNLDTGRLVNAAGPLNRDGFGALTTVRANSQRIIQVAGKIYF